MSLGKKRKNDDEGSKGISEPGLEEEVEEDGGYLEVCEDFNMEKAELEGKLRQDQ